MDASQPEPEFSEGALILDSTTGPAYYGYVMGGAPPAGVTNLEVTVNMRVVSGTLFNSVRAPAGIGITTAPDVGQTLWIGEDGITMNSDPDTAGPVARVDTSGGFHTYTIQVTGTNAGSTVTVFYDGSPVLTNYTYEGPPGYFHSEPTVSWGDLTPWTGGVSAWRSVSFSDVPARADSPSISCGETRTNVISSAQLTSVYEFAASAGQIVTILMGRSSGTLEPQVELYGPGGNLLASAWGIASATIWTQRIAQAGTCLIVCRDHYGTGTGGFGVSLACPSVPTIDRGETKTNTLVAGQMVCYQFPAQAGDIATVLMGRSSGTVEPEVALQTPDGSLAVNWGSSSATVWTQRIAQAGTCLIICRDHYGTGTGGFGVSLACLGVPTIARGETKTNTLVAGQMVCYQFPAQAGDIATVLMGRSSGTVEPEVALQAPDGSLAVNWGSSSATIWTQRIAQAGTCLIICRDHYGTGTGGFGVSLACLGVTHILPGETKTNVMVAGQMDAYQFEAGAGDTVTVLMGRSSGTVEPEVALQAPDGSLAVKWGSSSATVWTQRIAQAGTCLIICRDHYGTGTGGFGASLIKNPGANIGDPEGGDIEPNGPSRTGRLTPGDLDAFSFQANAGATVTIQMSRTGGTVEPQVELHGPDGALIGWGWGSSSVTIWTQRVTQAGTCLVVCRDHYGTGTGTYTVSLACVGCPSAQAPVITRPPENQTANAGATVNFTVAATGAEPLSYHWHFNGVPLSDGGQFSGTATTNLTIANVQSANAGTYSVVVSNLHGTATGSATLTVRVPPSITVQPVSQVVSLGDQVTFTVVATGTPPLGYQWQLNGTNLVGATGSAHIISSAQLDQAGFYTVLVSNAAGSVTSAPASLSFLDLRMYAGLTIFAPVGAAYQIDYATNLAEPTFWFDLTNVTLTSSPYRFVDWDSAAQPRRFYRAVPSP